MNRMFPAFAALLALGRGAEAKVVFTGYGDLRLTPESRFELVVPPAFPGVASGKFESRGATIDAVGLFAATALTEQSSFLFDLTFRDIGYTSQTRRIQYAYLETAPLPGLTLDAGKITLPFGYFNQKRFYAFQRASISAPTFQGSILGLPIADVGASAEHALAAGPFVARVAAYGVNGYGGVPTARKTFRLASAPGGLTIANNLGSVNSNKTFAGGGRVAVSAASAPGSEAGVSYYGGHWDPDAKSMFQMLNAHGRIGAGPVDILVEYLFLFAQDDAGFAANVGTPDWKTNGEFATLEWHGVNLLERALTPWARVEDYRTRGVAGGAGERLTGYAGGASWQALDAVAVKLECSWLDYSLPYRPAGKLGIKGYTLLGGLAVTF